MSVTEDYRKLAALGNQDYYLVSNPQISFLKKAYKRHTNFAIESLNIPLDENLGQMETDLKSK